MIRAASISIVHLTLILGLSLSITSCDDSCTGADCPGMDGSTSSSDATGTRRDAGPPPTVCENGTTQDCTCAGSSRGTQTCNAGTWGSCVCGDCTPDCANRNCGPDGCGGTCGSCGDGERCDPSSRQCVSTSLYDNPWVQSTYSSCAHGGDPSSCSGHGACQNQTYTDDGLPTGAGGSLQSHSPTLVASPRASSAGDTTLGCICDPGWTGKACNVETSAGQTLNEATQMPQWDGRDWTINSEGREVQSDHAPGLATYSIYSRLRNSMGTCVQTAWPLPFRAELTLPYRMVEGDDGQWTYGERIQGVAAVNNFQYGERVLRHNLNYPNPSTSCDSQPSGRGCGSCWELEFPGGTTYTFVVLDRCGGNCYGYPDEPDESVLSRCRFPERFRQHAGQGANWRRLLDDGETDECLSTLVDADCANFFLSDKGFEFPDGHTAASEPTLGYALAQAPSSHFRSETSSRGDGTRTYREWMYEIRVATGKGDRADHCAHNDAPHFDIDGDSAAALGLAGIGPIPDYRQIPCSPVGVNPDGSFMPTVSWPNGCDRDNWSNCGNLPLFDPDLNPNIDPASQRCCNTAEECGCTSDDDCQAPLTCRDMVCDFP